MSFVRATRHVLMGLLGSAGLTACAPGVGPGVDWSLDGRIAQRVEADLNRGLDDPAEGALLTTALDAGLVLDAETKRALFSANLGIAASYAGGDDSELAGIGRIDPRLGVSASYNGKTWSVSGNARLSVQQVSETAVEDAIFIEQDGTQIQTIVGGGFSQQLNERARVNLSLDAQILDFTNVQTLTPTRTFGATTGLELTVSDTTSASINIGVRHFTADDAEGTRSQTLDVSGGLTHQRTPRHTVRLRVGTTGVRTIEEIAGGSPSFDIGLTGNLGLTYALKNFRAGLDFTQGIEPSSVGQLVTLTRLGGSLGYRVDQDQRLGLNLNISRRTGLSGGGATTALSFGPGYSLMLNAETALAFNYLFRLNQDSGVRTQAMGHRVQLVLTHDFNLLQ